MILDIVTYPDKRLAAKAVLVTFPLDKSIIKLTNNMMETMLTFPIGASGLAANQVGSNLALSTIDLRKDSYHTKTEPFLIFNPKILEKKSPIRQKEGCLSLPGIRWIVDRFAEIKIEYQDKEGNSKTEEYKGLAAQIFQHEVDHLNGLLYIDRVGPVAKQMIEKKLKKQRKRYEQRSIRTLI